MPELPEVEITARRLGEALAGSTVESALAPGLNTLKTFDPPLHGLEGGTITTVRRIGKHLVVALDAPGAGGDVALLLHLMSAGRLQLFEKRASMKDRANRLLLRIADEDGKAPSRELRLKEFGTKQAAWAKLLRADELAADPALATLGPEAWPDPPADLREVLGPQKARPLQAVLRDQRVIAGIGRSWVDEILWEAKLSPFARAGGLADDEAAALRGAIVARMGAALDHYEQTVKLPIPDKMPLPLLVHRHHGEPCPRCGTTIEAVHYDEQVLCYCPQCQTGGKVLKDRRLSRLLK